MGRVVLHLDKSPGNEAKMTAHIERTQMPANANPELTHLNRELIKFQDGVANRTEAIQHRLDNAGLTRKIGTNQVRAIRVILSATNEDMKRIEAEGRLDEWCKDNIAWVGKTYGKDNLVSAVLHLDEATPHIHATVVPIVTGERRKAKEKKAEPGKKKYRKKNPNAARLCVDDVMTRIDLKHFQDTYAEAMKKYGLERGIDGSEARHISTQEFYRKAIAQKANLQENIESLLQFEDAKRGAVEELMKREQEARILAEQAAVEKQQTEAELAGKQTELQKVKGELKTEKFKSTAAEAGSATGSATDNKAPLVLDFVILYKTTKCSWFQWTMQGKVVFSIKSLIANLPPMVLKPKFSAALLMLNNETPLRDTNVLSRIFRISALTP